MTYETKNILHFHVIRVKASSDSRCSRTLPMNVAIESAHHGCERNSCKDWARVEEMWKAWSNMIKGIALYQSVILRLSNLFRENCAEPVTLITCVSTPRLKS